MIVARKHNESHDKLTLSKCNEKRKVTK